MLKNDKNKVKNTKNCEKTTENCDIILEVSEELEKVNKKIKLICADQDASIDQCQKIERQIDNINKEVSALKTYEEGINNHITTYITQQLQTNSSLQYYTEHGFLLLQKELYTYELYNLMLNNCKGLSILSNKKRNSLMEQAKLQASEKYDELIKEANKRLMDCLNKNNKHE